MASIALIGVPSQSGGRPIGVARGVGALRAAGVVSALAGAGHQVHDRGDARLPRPDPTRDPDSHVVHPQGLSAVVRSVTTEVGGAFEDGRFPLVIGGDCPILLGALAAMGRGGLLHVDGHEDAYLPEQSPSGEPADSEIAFALGMVRASWDEDFADRQPLVRLEHLAMLGPRDQPDLDRHGVASLRGRCMVADDVAVRADPDAAVSEALAHLRSAPGGFWLHLDWDVLSNDQIGSVMFPRDGGLAWSDLATIVAAALSDPACAGWSAGTYNPDLDPDGVDAVTIVEFLTMALRALDEREERTA